jgi:selenocysteine-specific elongation factor
VNRHVVVGTAGHVDHGKTALVKALTGTDTDRWAEEKRRGITIDLGFARLNLSDGLTASIVDVPGHEDFVRNMVAGATGVDVALLVVAADEGVMPQTAEHLAILEFLGVRAGVVAISKTDLAEPDWLDLVVTDVMERVSTSSVAWESPVHWSAVTDQGREELLGALSRAAERATLRSDDDLFRMPVDRVFSIPGAGTVVTGTSWSGTVAVGSFVRVMPGDTRARVRSVEVHGESRERAEPGRRTALALPGTERDDIARGSVVVSDETWRECSVIDVMLTLLPDVKPITQRSRVRLHLGTAEIMARVTPERGDIAPGSTAAARLRLEQPVVARWGDRGVIRSYSPIDTVGGCVVVDPFPPLRPRRPVKLERRLVRDPAERARTVIELAGWHGVAPADLPVRVGVHPSEVQALVAELGRSGVTEIGGQLLGQSVLDEARRGTLGAIADYHGAHRLEPGMPRELARSVLSIPSYADAVHGLLVEAGDVVLEAETIRLAQFTATLSDGQRELTKAILRVLEAEGARGATEAELAEAVGTSGIREVAGFMLREGRIVRVGPDRYYEVGAVERLRDQILGYMREHGRATPAQLREITSLTRKYLIPILEWLDTAGYTRRDGDARRLGPAAPKVG